MTKLLGLTGSKQINIIPHAANTTIGISNHFILTNKLAGAKKMHSKNTFFRTGLIRLTNHVRRMCFFIILL